MGLHEIPAWYFDSLPPEGRGEIFRTNEKLKDMSVRSLLEGFGVEFIATTDDPADSLSDHRTYGGINVTPTFRPDKLFLFEESYIEKLGKAADIEINSLEELMAFQAEVGEELIIGTSYTDNKFPLIEIYDSYRE